MLRRSWQLAELTLSLVWIVVTVDAAAVSVSKVDSQSSNELEKQAFQICIKSSNTCCANCCDRCCEGCCKEECVCGSGNNTRYMCDTCANIINSNLSPTVNPYNSKYFVPQPKDAPVGPVLPTQKNVSNSSEASQTVEDLLNTTKLPYPPNSLCSFCNGEFKASNGSLCSSFGNQLRACTANFSDFTSINCSGCHRGCKCAKVLNWATRCLSCEYQTSCSSCCSLFQDSAWAQSRQTNLKCDWNQNLGNDLLKIWPTIPGLVILPPGYFYNPFWYSVSSDKTKHTITSGNGAQQCGSREMTIADYCGNGFFLANETLDNGQTIAICRKCMDAAACKGYLGEGAIFEGSCLTFIDNSSCATHVSYLTIFDITAMVIQRAEALTDGDAAVNVTEANKQKAAMLQAIQSNIADQIMKEINRTRQLSIGSNETTNISVMEISSTELAFSNSVGSEKRSERRLLGFLAGLILAPAVEAILDRFEPTDQGTLERGIFTALRVVMFCGNPLRNAGKSIVQNVVQNVVQKELIPQVEDEIYNFANFSGGQYMHRPSMRSLSTGRGATSPVINLWRYSSSASTTSNFVLMWTVVAVLMVKTGV